VVLDAEHGPEPYRRALATSNYGANMPTTELPRPPPSLLPLRRHGRDGHLDRRRPRVPRVERGRPRLPRGRVDDFWTAMAGGDPERYVRPPQPPDDEVVALVRSAGRPSGRHLTAADPTTRRGASGHAACVAAALASLTDRGARGMPGRGWVGRAASTRRWRSTASTSSSRSSRRSPRAAGRAGHHRALHSTDAEGSWAADRGRSAKASPWGTVRPRCSSRSGRSSTRPREQAFTLRGTDGEAPPPLIGGPAGQLAPPMPVTTVPLGRAGLSVTDQGRRVVPAVERESSATSRRGRPFYAALVRWAGRPSASRDPSSRGSRRPPGPRRPGRDGVGRGATAERECEDPGQPTRPASRAAQGAAVSSDQPPSAGPTGRAEDDPGARSGDPPRTDGCPFRRRTPSSGGLGFRHDGSGPARGEPDRHGGLQGCPVRAPGVRMSWLLVLISKAVEWSVLTLTPSSGRAPGRRRIGATISHARGSDLLVVYGTRIGDGLAGAARRRRPGRVRRPLHPLPSLFELGCSIGLVLDGAGLVVAEALRLLDRRARRLRPLRGLRPGRPDEGRRLVVRIRACSWIGTGPAEASVDAWVYELRVPPTDRLRVVGGDSAGPPDGRTVAPVRVLG
jgi:hypothetical protein